MSTNGGSLVSTPWAHNLPRIALKKLSPINGSATLGALEALKVEGMPVVHSVSHCDGPSALVAFFVGLVHAALTIRLSVTLLHLPVLTHEGLLAGRTNKTVQVVGLERKCHPFFFDYLQAGSTFGGCLLSVAGIAHDATGHFVELPIDKPGTAHTALETIGVPASIPMFKIANTWLYPLLAPLTLSDWFRAVGTDYVIVNDKVTLADEILPTPFANKALSVVVLPFDRHLLLVYTNDLLTPVTIRGVLSETAIAKAFSLVRG